MADYIEVMNTVWQVEHGGRDELVLHYNPKEKSYTFYGIYPYTKLPSWRKIRDVARKAGNIHIASRILAKDTQLYQEVLNYYYEHYWKPMELDFVESTQKAKEIMVFVVNVGIGRKRQIVKAIQRICGAKVDGIIGKETIRKLNECDEVKFSTLFDAYEISFYDRLVRRHPRLRWALRGWRRRARFV